MPNGLKVSNCIMSSNAATLVMTAHDLADEASLPRPDTRGRRGLVNHENCGTTGM
jgi:hypothetical protein